MLAMWSPHWLCLNLLVCFVFENNRRAFLWYFPCSWGAHLVRSDPPRIVSREPLFKFLIFIDTCFWYLMITIIMRWHRCTQHILILSPSPPFLPPVLLPPSILWSSLQFKSPISLFSNIPLNFRGKQSATSKSPSYALVLPILKRVSQEASTYSESWSLSWDSSSHTALTDGLKESKMWVFHKSWLILILITVLVLILIYKIE